MTRAFKLGFSDNINYFDVNSEYPFIMRYRKSFTKYLGTEENIRYNLLENSGIVEVYLKSIQHKYPQYLSIIDEKTHSYVYPYLNEFVKFKITTDELKFLLDNNLYELQYGVINKIWKFESDYVFNEYIDFVYNLKAEAKKNKDDISCLIAKLLLNSLYGSFGIKQKARNTEILNYKQMNHNLFLGMLYSCQPVIRNKISQKRYDKINGEKINYI